jgi:hypothetical protein
MQTRTYAAGVLAVCDVNGTLCVLMSKDRFDNLWSDLGGRSEAVDRGDPRRTAMREFDEESCGVVATSAVMQKRIAMAPNIIHKSTRWLTYTMFIVAIPYMPWIRRSFHNALAFLKRVHAPPQILEKCDIRYVPFSSLFELQLKDHFACTLTHYWTELHAHAMAVTGMEPALRPRNFLPATYSIDGRVCADEQVEGDVACAVDDRR